MAVAPQQLEGKLVVLGSQGVGKTSLVNRILNPNAPLATPVSTVGASFVTQKIYDPDSGTVLRLQVWDTAGQERFRSISRLYYRGAHAACMDSLPRGLQVGPFD
jgi:small GTP-binding protein